MRANKKREKKMRKVKSANAVIGATAIGIPFSLQGVPVISESPKEVYHNPAIKLKSNPAYTYSIN